MNTNVLLLREYRFKYVWNVLKRNEEKIIPTFRVEEN